MDPIEAFRLGLVMFCIAFEASCLPFVYIVALEKLEEIGG